jgi:lipoprotein-releasing system permease protein
MYKTLLILKYLRKRRIAWVSLVAVMLCTAMVLVVLSVMGGWLRMFRESFQALSGDVLVEGRSLVGFPQYEEIIRQIEALPEVKAAAPVIRTFGLLSIDDPRLGALERSKIRKGVEVIGYPANIQEVNGFRDSLYRLGGNLEGILVDSARADELRKRGGSARSIHEAASASRAPPSPDAPAYSVVTPAGIYPLDGFGNDLARAYLRKERVSDDPAAAARVRIRADETPSGALKRGASGVIAVEAISDARKLHFDLWPDTRYVAREGYRGPDVRTWDGMIVGTGVIGLRKDSTGNIGNRTSYQYTVQCDLTVLPMEPDTGIVEPTSRARNFYWLIDDSRTKVHLYDSNTVYVPFETLQRDLMMDENAGLPARTSNIQIALKAGADPRAVKPKIEAIVSQVLKADPLYPVEVLTWEQTHATFLGAVEKEKGLMTILFGMISIVAVFLIFCIFYMIVVEKTRDIGIVKSIGATSQGVAGIFLGYGAAIGIVGGMLGTFVGWMVVRYINELHEMLGRFGVVMWNPEIYLFETIPNTINPRETAVIVAVAIVSSVLGALVPAWRAARMHPVEALRWE